VAGPSRNRSRMAAGTTVCPREVIVLRIDELRKFSYGNSAGWGLGSG
jgi:hypothetical protein